MIQHIRNLVSKNEEGASAVEYGLLVAAIAAVIVAVVFVLGGYVQSAFQDTCDEMASQSGAANC